MDLDENVEKIKKKFDEDQKNLNSSTFEKIKMI